MHTWQTQDACALSRHCEPCKQSSWSQARNSQENRPFLIASGVATQRPTWTIAVSWERPWICTPANARYPITAGWTGWRHMENQMENCQSGAWTWPWAKDTTHTHTHTHTLNRATLKGWCSSAKQIDSCIVVNHFLGLVVAHLCLAISWPLLNDRLHLLQVKGKRVGTHTHTSKWVQCRI